jgi:hypothetical protein
MSFTSQKEIIAKPSDHVCSDFLLWCFCLYKPSQDQAPCDVNLVDIRDFLTRMQQSELDKTVNHVKMFYGEVVSGQVVYIPPGHIVATCNKEKYTHGVRCLCLSKTSDPEIIADVKFYSEWPCLADSDELELQQEALWSSHVHRMMTTEHVAKPAVVAGESQALQAAPPLVSDVQAAEQAAEHAAKTAAEQADFAAQAAAKTAEQASVHAAQQADLARQAVEEAAAQAASAASASQGQKPKRKAK